MIKRSWTEALEQYAIPFAAGVLLTVAIVGLIPEVEHALGDIGYLAILVSFLGAYVFEQLICGLHHHGHEEHGDCRPTKGSVWLVLVGDTIHNFIDGVAIGASYLISPGLGLATAISTLLHEVPHEIGDFGVLLNTGWKRTRVLLVNGISAAVSLLGALLALGIKGEPEILGWFLAISTGLFLFLGASDFLPKVVENEKRSLKPVLALLLGVVIMVGTLFLVPDNH